MKNKQYSGGFSTVFLVMILSSICLLLMVLVEAACGYALASEGGAYLDVTGRSLLAGYDRALYDQYGLFALQQSETALQETAFSYLEYDTQKSTGITSMQLKEVQVSSEAYPGLSSELLGKQLAAAGQQIALSAALSGEDAADICSSLLSFSLEAESMQNMSLAELDDFIEEAAAAAAGNGDVTGEKTETGSAAVNTAEVSPATINSSGASEAKALKRRYEKAVNPDWSGAENSIRFSSLCDASALPTRLLDISQGQSVDLSSLSGLEDVFFTGEYILFVCSDFTSQSSSCRYPAETEYILFGKDGSMANVNAMRQKLFEIRFAVQLAAVYADPHAMSEIHAAALGFAPAPEPLAAFVLACCRASSEAIADVNQLQSGRKVALLPSALRGDGKSLSLSYEDYLRILLLCLPQNVKVIRLMDVIQCNMLSAEEFFSFRSCAYGISLSVRFERKIMPFLSDLFSNRTGYCSRTYEYQ